MRINSRTKTVEIILEQNDEFEIDSSGEPPYLFVGGGLVIRLSDRHLFDLGQRIEKYLWQESLGRHRREGEK